MRIGNGAQTEETKKKISEHSPKYWLGKKMSEDSRRKMSESHKGRIPWNKGMVGVISEESRKRMSMAQRGLKKPKLSLSMAGRKLSEETKSKMSLSHGGNGTPNIRSKYYHTHDYKYKEWRTKVFERDNWTCQTCGLRGCKLEPHHVKGWAKFPEYRYDVENGVTLCLECHRLTRKKPLL